MGFLYQLTSPNGKSYIGITSKSLDNRWTQHIRNAKKGRGIREGEECIALYSAMRKYGHTSFATKLLAEVGDWAELCALECRAIERFNTFAPNGYNLTLGGDGTLGTKPSEKSRLKMSKSQRRANLNPETAKKKRAALAKAVSVRLDNWYNKSPEEKAAWGLRHGAKVRAGHSTPASKLRTQLAARKRAADPAIRHKLSVAQTGVKRAPWTEERKQRAAQKKRAEWRDPDLRAKRLAGFALAREKNK